jgi:hypothetical protein
MGSNQPSITRRAAAVLIAVSAALILLLSNLMLARLGVNYEAQGGAAWQKIHPASYVAILALIAQSFAAGNPFAFVDDVLRRQPGAAVFMLALVGLFVWVVVRIQGPVTQLVDTFLTPWILFLLLTRRTGLTLRALALGLHAFMAVNALLGLAEFAGGFRVTPLMAEGVELTGDWRSSALLGHPLFNAAAAASYTFMLLIGGARDLPEFLRAPAFGLQLVSMAVFGGRAATVMFAAFAVVALVWLIWSRRDAIRLTPAAAAGWALFAMVCAGVGIVLALEGFFDQFLRRFLEDQGSADARLSMFELLRRVPMDQLWLGSDPAWVSTMQRLQGIPFGIESFWIAAVVNYGLVAAIPFFLAFLALMNEYRRALVPGTAAAIVLFLMIISTSTSLASKTAMLSYFTIAACLLLRPPHSAAA